MEVEKETAGTGADDQQPPADPAVDEVTPKAKAQAKKKPRLSGAALKHWEKLKDRTLMNMRVGGRVCMCGCHRTMSLWNRPHGVGFY